MEKVLAFDIGGTKIFAAVVDNMGRILEEKRIETPKSSWIEAENSIADLAKYLIRSFPEIKKCGISSAGPLNAAQGLLLNPTNLDWGQVPIVSNLKKRLALDVVLENDAAAAAIAEHWCGEYKDSPSLLTLTLGTGLGVGLILNHKLQVGGSGLHPEGGHLLLQPGDPNAQCGCGNYGCAEAYLAGSHFLRRVQRKLKDDTVTMTKIVSMAENKDPNVTDSFKEYGIHLAQFIYNYIMLSYPAVVVLSGGFSQAYSYFLPTTIAALRPLLSRRLIAVPNIMPIITTSKLNLHSGIIGAAKVALDL